MVKAKRFFHILMALAIVITLFNFVRGGIRCYTGANAYCNEEIKEISERRWKLAQEMKNEDKNKHRQENNFWLMILSLDDNEVVVDAD